MTGWLKHRGAKPLAALAAITALCLNLAAAIAMSRPASAQAQNRAGLVVAYANGAIETRCVTFSEASITGYEMMRRSGLAFSAQVSGLGAAMCKIGDQGCSYPAQSCFCKCENPASGCGYWIYGQWSGSSWRYAGVGAVARTITDGQIDGWVWDVVNADAAAVRLPAVTLGQICAPQAAPTGSPPTVSAPTRVVVTAPPSTRAPATLAPPAFTATPPPQASVVSTVAATGTPVAALVTAAPITAPTVTVVAASEAQPATRALPTPTELPAVSMASPAPTATLSPIVNASAASGEGIAGFLGIMAVLGGGALIWQRFGSRGGRR
ncbi:MAG TPA: hypothetical protein PKY66_14445 [Thermoflexales bacterium]|nr:hypothetical protein [Anaerolineae bacterium]HQX11615.1 hypothetical protein [Thermoflexales bacterium]